MTRGRGFKRLVRRRMGKTGESYTSARAQFSPIPQGSQASRAGGGTTVNPFDRLTQRAKDALELARGEAERSGHSYIGTEHVLLGLLIEARGLSSQVLRGMGVETGAVRRQIAAVLGPTESMPLRQIVPTSRVKRVIEIAFDEARGMGQNYVGTEHLLLGLLIEGQGIAARVLTERGVTLAEVRTRIDRALAAGPEVSGEALRGFPRGGRARPPWSAELVALLEAAEMLARREHAEMVRSDHLGRALLRGRGPGLASLLAACGADLDLARRRLRLPAAIRRLQTALLGARRERVEATVRDDEEAALAAGERVDDLRRQLGQALEAWQARWGVAP